MKKWTPPQKDWFDRMEDEFAFRYNRGDIFPQIIIASLASVIVLFLWLAIIIVSQLGG